MRKEGRSIYEQHVMGMHAGSGCSWVCSMLMAGRLTTSRHQHTQTVTAKPHCVCGCRRRGEVFGELLSSFADDSWTQLDLAGCSRLYGAEILAAAPRMPKLTALDVTGEGV